MTRDEWKVLYREARTLAKEGSFGYKNTCQKDVEFTECRRAVVKIPRGDSVDWKHAATFEEEEFLYKLIPARHRPWTVWHPNGFCLQQAVTVSYYTEGPIRTMIERCRQKGFTDLHAANVGTTEDDRPVVIDWGVVDQHGPLLERLERRRNIRHGTIRERNRRMRERVERMTQEHKYFIYTVGDALRTHLEDMEIHA